MKIRSCVAGDFDQVHRLLSQLWPEMRLKKDPLKRTFVRGLKSNRIRYFCAVDGESVIGFCSLNVRASLWQQGWLAHIDELVVDEGRRNEGIGSALLEKAAAYARKQGCARLELDSALHRKRAHRFYERLAFERTAYVFSRPLS